MPFPAPSCHYSGCRSQPPQGNVSSVFLRINGNFRCQEESRGRAKRDPPMPPTPYIKIRYCKGLAACAADPALKKQCGMLDTSQNITNNSPNSQNTFKKHSRNPSKIDLPPNPPKISKTRAKNALATIFKKWLTTFWHRFGFHFSNFPMTAQTPEIDDSYTL